MTDPLMLHRKSDNCSGDNEDDVTVRKRTMRKRRKKIFAEIREQVEFYLSDCNLRKDRYLRQVMMRTAGKELLIGTEAVPISELLRFNRIRSLTTSEEDISRSISSSDLLVVSPDGASVSRRQAVDFDKNCDLMTLYVENLPENVSHEWLKNVFSAFGTVTYVSIPKFKDQRTKGFAFIEFSNEAAMRSACHNFNDHMPSDDQKHNEELLATGATKAAVVPAISEMEELPEKRIKLSDSTRNELSEGLECSIWKDRSSESGIALPAEVRSLNLRVMSKEEWTKWKRHYRRLQTENMRKVKASIKQQQVTGVPVIPNAVASKLANLMNPAAAQPQLPKGSKEDFDSGSVIKLLLTKKESELLEEAVIKKEIREAAARVPLSYIDMDMTQTQFGPHHNVTYTCFVRCSSKSDAQSLIDDQAFQSLGTAAVVRGDEESRYRQRMAESRQCQKRKQENRSRKGFKKLIEKSDKCVNTSAVEFVDR